MFGLFESLQTRNKKPSKCLSEVSVLYCTVLYCKLLTCSKWILYQQRFTFESFYCHKNPPLNHQLSLLCFWARSDPCVSEQIEFNEGEPRGEERRTPCQSPWREQQCCCIYAATFLLTANPAVTQTRMESLVLNNTLFSYAVQKKAKNKHNTSN